MNCSFFQIDANFTVYSKFYLNETNSEDRFKMNRQICACTIFGGTLMLVLLVSFLERTYNAQVYK